MIRPHRSLAMGVVHSAAEGADLRSGFIRAGQQLLCAERRLCGNRSSSFMRWSAAYLAKVLAQQLAGSVDRADGPAGNPTAPALVFRSIRAGRCN